MSVARVTWEEAQKLARRAPNRGFMAPASAIEILLPDIGGTFADIRRFGRVDAALKFEYHRLRGECFAYGGEDRRRAAERALDAVLDAERALLRDDFAGEMRARARK